MRMGLSRFSELFQVFSYSTFEFLSISDSAAHNFSSRPFSLGMLKTQIQHHPYDSADHNTLSTRNTNISSMSQRSQSRLYESKGRDHYKMRMGWFPYNFSEKKRNNYYVNYMLMKKKVKQYAERIGGGSQYPRHVQKDFSRTLDTQVRESYRDIGRDILQLLVFVELKAIGLRKIEYDKRFGY
ncbi:hypothetical protein HID58_085703 [Brassica napus]|uniref:Uncharacterized protein n=1 Tax=Brassica napus TaxID=3708 RepID=A0ABQ7XQ97_BRANA|nr:hypothetical protein HID58_085703 [Brassica napus]